MTTPNVNIKQPRPVDWAIQKSRRLHAQLAAAIDAGNRSEAERIKAELERLKLQLAVKPTLFSRSTKTRAKKLEKQLRRLSA